MTDTIQIPEALSSLDIEGSPKEIETERVVGQVLLLPSDIHPEVALRYKNKQSYASGITLSCVMKLKSAERRVVIADQGMVYEGNLEDSEARDLVVPVPELLYVTDLNYSPYSKKPPIHSYLYRYDTEKSLPETYATVEQYFFPHIYHDSHMCIMSQAFSPREMLSYFWASNFHNNWWDLFDQHRENNFDSDGLVKATGPDVYIKYQNEAKSTSLNTRHRNYMATYGDHMYVEAKPLGIFVSQQEIPELNERENRIYSYLDEASIFAGLAFHANDGHCWVYARDKTLIRLRPEQVKVL